MVILFRYFTDTMKARFQDTRTKYQNILVMIFLSIGYGVTYNFLFYPHNLAEYMEAITIGVFLGTILGFVEEFVLKSLFLRLAFYKVLIIRTVLYSFFISIVLSMVLSIEISFDQDIAYLEALLWYLKGAYFRRDFFFSLAFVFMIIFSTQVVQIIGLNNLVRLILGQYHKPREVRRIFMFIDLNESTMLAEKMDNELYSAFVKEYFNDLSDAINSYGGEIYQYVGDEISVVWPASDKSSQFLNCFFKAQDIIADKASSYHEKYGFVPKFKASAHVGKVVVTEVGKLKKELVYHGDVVNTTSRIIGKCHELNETFLISAEVLALSDQADLNIAEQGELTLKGKSQVVNLYGVHHD
ncbi:MAG: adenylate/guanylate cyclase domain-containing protein [Reichenbachiella sp.]|uniref:adenylate/guanylate cyclase domain-containing protein n=1 Tax=Reichenbachiella sp. TaxID=2184521 RepID=UPI00326547CF